MNLSLPKFSRKSWTIITTIAIITACYSYYFFVFVVQNEQRLNEKSYRTLSLISDNINAKYKNLTKLAKFSAQQPVNLELKSSLDSLHKIEDEIWEKKDRLNDQINKLSVNDSLNLRPKLYEKLDLINAYYLSIIHTMEAMEDSVYSNQLFLGLLNRNLEDYYLTASIGRSQVESKDPSISFSETIELSEEPTQIEFEITLENFLKSLFKNGNFSHYMVVAPDTKEILHQTFEDRILASTLKNFLDSASSEGEDCVSTLRSGGTNYTPYLFNMKFRGDEEWLLMGFLQTDIYNKQVKQINIWVILIVAIAILLLVLIMPVLKLALMNEIERLHIGNVVMTGMSIVIGAPPVAMIILVLFYYAGNDLQIVDKRLADLSKEVDSAFSSEIRQGKKQLFIYDQKRTSNQGKKTRSTGESVIKLFGKDSSHLSVYPNYNEMFWMDSTGLQMEVLLPEDNYRVKQNGERERIYLKSRAYFTDVLNQRMWGDHKDSLIAFQSIISWSTGKREVAISKVSKVPEYPVATITSSFSSVIDVIAPMGYGFFVIDKEG
ncbi:MAG: hypothetical protein GY816_17490 [Cytophagales bacterium]|nr:hypothetical protein [Cytophagales bacterium]